MVAINEILLSECTGEECVGDNDICTDSRVHHRNAENRAPITRNHRSAPSLGRWMEQDPAQYIDGANTYQFVDSSPVGNVDAAGESTTAVGRWFEDVYHQVPGGEFVDATGVIPDAVLAWIKAQAKSWLIWDYSKCPTGNALQDPPLPWPVEHVPRPAAYPRRACRNSAKTQSSGEPELF